MAITGTLTNSDRSLRLLMIQTHHMKNALHSVIRTMCCEASL